MSLGPGHRAITLESSLVPNALFGLGLVIAVLGSGCAATGPEPTASAPTAGGPSAAEPAPETLRRFFESYFRAVEDGAPAPILAHIDADFVLRWGGRPIQDQPNLHAVLEGLQATVRQSVDWELLEGRVAGAWAWARVREKATHHPKAGGQPRVLEGTHLMVLRRVDGGWRIHRDHAMLDQPVAGAR